MKKIVDTSDAAELGLRGLGCGRVLGLEQGIGVRG